MVPITGWSTPEECVPRVQLRGSSANSSTLPQAFEHRSRQDCTVATLRARAADVDTSPRKYGHVNHHGAEHLLARGNATQFLTNAEVLAGLSAENTLRYWSRHYLPLPVAQKGKEEGQYQRWDDEPVERSFSRGTGDGTFGNSMFLTIPPKAEPFCEWRQSACAAATWTICTESCTRLGAASSPPSGDTRSSGASSS